MATNGNFDENIHGKLPCRFGVLYYICHTSNGNGGNHLMIHRVFTPKCIVSMTFMYYIFE